MRVCTAFRWIWRLLKSGQQPTVVPRPTSPEEPQFADNLPPGFVPIETQISGQHIDGTGRWIGQDARVGQMPSGELVTCERTRGVRCGCGHIVYSVQETITQSGIHAGIGGICSDCAAEADDLVKRNALSPGQAEAMSLYCSRCASHCDNCGRHNLCSRHTRLLINADGKQQQLCPECLARADRKRLFRQTIATVGWLFAEDDKSSLPKREGGYYDRD